MKPGDQVTYTVAEQPAPGVSTAYIVLHEGKAGPGWVIPVAQLVDLDGRTHIQPTGPARPVRIIDDTQENR